MFLRWLFLFLVLANVLVLLWYSSFVTEKAGPIPTVAESLNNIRLLSEMEPGALNVIASEAESGPDQCLTFSDFSQQQEAGWLVSAARAEGLAAEASAIGQQEDLYVIKVEITDASDISQALVDYLRENRGLGVGLQELEPGALYVLGRFADRAEAENELQQVVISGVPAYLVLERIDDRRYAVVIYEEGDRKLSSEIKELVAERYSDIKITKKICERVARP